MTEQFTSGYLPEKKNYKTLIPKGHHPYVHCSIVYNDQDMETT